MSDRILENVCFCFCGIHPPTSKAQRMLEPFPGYTCVHAFTIWLYLTLCKGVGKCSQAILETA